MDVDNANINQSRDVSVGLKCDNCSSWLQNDLQLENEDVTKVGSTITDSEVQIWNALAFIYGVSWMSIENYRSGKRPEFLKTQEDLRFCSNCTSLLNDNYNSHLKFEHSIGSSSFVQLLKEFRYSEINSTEKENDVHIIPNDLVEREIKVDVFADFVPEDTEEDDFQSEDPVESKYDPPSTSPENFSDLNISSIISERIQLTPVRLRSKRQLVIKAEKLSTEEILKFTNKANPKKKRGRPKNPKTSNNLNNIARKRKMGPQFTPGPSFNERVKLILEKYEDNKSSKCPKISILGRYICTVCGKSFQDFDYLRFKHWVTHREDAPDKGSVCDTCGKYLKKGKYMKWHMLRVHASEEEQNKWKTKCNLCDEIVFSFAMSYHLSLKHSKLPEVKCNQCGKNFVNTTRLKTHSLEVHSNASEKCDLCDKVFTSPIYLRNHKRKIHGYRERKYCCEICPIKTCTKSELDTHMFSHTDVRQYICDECGKTFKYNAHFRTHMKCHREIAENGGSTFSCELCEGKTFKHSLSLQKHRKIVHGQGNQKIYECSVCGKQLSSATILRDHENMHKNKPGFVPRVRKTLPEYIKGRISGGNSYLAVASQLNVS